MSMSAAPCQCGQPHNIGKLHSPFSCTDWPARDADAQLQQPSTPSVPTAPQPQTPTQAQGARLIKALSQANENWLVQLEIIDFQSKRIRAKYEALIAQGFPEDTALKLCMVEWSA